MIPSAIYIYVHDHLYSPVAVANLFGSSIIERYEYDAYGNCTVLEGDPNNFEVDADGISDFGNPYYFTGRRLDVLDDGDLKIMYYRNRYYDTETGRFLSNDPLGTNPSGQINNTFASLSQTTDGINLYEYISSKPTLYVDPTGFGQYKIGSDAPPNSYLAAYIDSRSTYNTWPRTWSNFSERMRIKTKVMAAIIAGPALVR